ncbi:MAG: hypothetical protein SGILL_000493 [Bacillariaceae sp.]
MSACLEGPQTPQEEDRISVLWPTDQVWYDGEVIDIDGDRHLIWWDCDAEKEWLNLSDFGWKKSSKTLREKKLEDTAKRKKVECLQVGTRISVWWSGDNRFFSGIIKSIDFQKKKPHYIHYDDGDKQYVDLFFWAFKVEDGRHDNLKIGSKICVWNASCTQFLQAKVIKIDDTKPYPHLLQYGRVAISQDWVNLVDHEFYQHGVAVNTGPVGSQLRPSQRRRQRNPTMKFKHCPDGLWEVNGVIGHTGPWTRKDTDHYYGCPYNVVVEWKGNYEPTEEPLHRFSQEVPDAVYEYAKNNSLLEQPVWNRYVSTPDESDDDMEESSVESDSSASDDNDMDDTEEADCGSIANDIFNSSSSSFDDNNGMMGGMYIPKKDPGQPDVSNNIKCSPLENAKTANVQSKELFAGAPDDFIEGGWPTGWCKRKFERTSSRVDRYWYTPIEYYKLRSMCEVKRFMAALDTFNGDEQKAWKALKGKK